MNSHPQQRRPIQSPRWRCLLGHAWVGCRCERCGKVRDEAHDWQHCLCRRCGLSRFSNHDWQGCVCRCCGKENHHWVKGTCVACGEVCTHEEVHHLPIDSSPPSARLQPHRICPRCNHLTSIT